MRCPVRSAQLHFSKVIVVVVAVALGWSAGCGSSSTGDNNGALSGDGGSGGSGGGSGSGIGGGTGGFVLPDVSKCTASGGCIMPCPDATKHTTLSGTVYDPAGNNPIPGVAVYVPASVPLDALPKGATCGD